MEELSPRFIKFKKIASKFLLVLPFFAMTACGSTSPIDPDDPPVPPTPPTPDTYTLDITCKGCNIGGEHKIHETHDRNEDLEYNFLPDSVEYNLPGDLEVRIGGESGRGKYTYNSTNGHFTIRMTGDVVINAVADTEYVYVVFANTGDTYFPYQKIKAGGCAFDPGKPSKEFYEFKGWYKDSDLGNEFNFNLPVYQNTTVYAGWEQTQYYCVTFDSQDGSTVDSEWVKRGEHAHAPAPPTKKYYEFVGWTRDPQGYEPYDFEEAKVYHNITLYAKWVKARYMVTFHVIDATHEGSHWEATGDTVPKQFKISALTNITDFYNDHISALSIVIEHFHFFNWSYTQDGSKPVAFDDFVEGDTDLYPIFEANIYKATFTVGSTPNAGWIKTDETGKEELVPTVEVTVPYGETPPDIGQPIRRNDQQYAYAFDGYNQEIHPVVGDETDIYTAQWSSSLMIYSLSFEANGGKWFDGTTRFIADINYGETWKDVKDSGRLPTASPERFGYDFNNIWTLQANEGSTQIKDTYMFKGHKTVYAYWDRHIYHVTFNSMGGSDVDAQDIPFEGTVSVPAPPTRTGYGFDGWYTEDGVEYDFNAPVQSDFTLYAHWNICHYTLTFDPGDGEIVRGEATQIVDFDTPLLEAIERQGIELYKTGYHFDKWFVNGHEVTDKDKMPADDLTITATYAINTYTLTFYYEGSWFEPEVYAEKDVEYNTEWRAIQKPEPPGRLGYEFLHWSTTRGGPKVPDDWKMPPGDASVYAVWEPNSYPIYINGNGGAWHGDPVIIREIRFDDPWSTILGDDKEKPVRVGYNFDYYSLDPVGLFPVDLSEHYTDLSQTDAYAQWTIKYFTVNFVTNCSQTVSPQDIAYGDYAYEPHLDKREGFTFKGWYLDSEFRSKFDFDTPIKSDLTLYAKWDINSWTLEFVVPEGAQVYPADAQTYFTNVEYGTKIAELPNVPDRAEMIGHTFFGWKDETVTIDPNYTMPDRDVTLIADLQIDSYKVTFLADGEFYDEQLVEYNQMASPPEKGDPSKEGFTFKGWYDNPEFSGTPFNFDTTPITENITLYAKFDINHHNITLNASDGEFKDGEKIKVIENVEYGTNILSIISDTPGMTGYSFNHWSYVEGDPSPEQEVGKDATLPDDNIIIYAIYLIDTYRVTFVDNTEECDVPPQDIVYMEHATEPTDVHKYGYDLEGWYDNPDFSGAAFDFVNTPITGPITLYAKWTPHPYNVKFLNYDGSLFNEQTVSYLNTPLDPGTPECPPEDAYATYEFAGWDKDITQPITENTVFIAQFTANPKDYTITWNVRDTEGQPTTITEYKHYGDELTAPETVKEYDKDGYHYTFIGFSPTITTVMGDATYDAQYKREQIRYKVTWLNIDGTELQCEELFPGTVPEYYSGTPTYSKDGHQFEFIGWDKEIVAVTDHDLTFTAVYNEDVSMSFEGVNCTVNGLYKVHRTLNFDDAIDFTVVADFGYRLPDTIEVYVDGVLLDVSQYTYNSLTGHFHLDHAKGNVRIIVGGVPV
ncbi:MAG: InlB B-repeat-containing protein [Bacilli bacterium]|nr:InlB B-repeat-containing protein [Bacilli bacterium]